MKFDFTSLLDRRGMDAVAVEPWEESPYRKGVTLREGCDPIPMWIADMSFPVAPPIIEALQKRVAHPSFGYFRTRQAYYDAIIRWHEKRNGVVGLLPEHIGYENGVLGGVATALQVLCSAGESVLVHAPTYVGFTNTLKRSGYNIVHSELRKDEAGVYRMDYEDMDRKLRENRIHAAIFCSPHNPTGRVWERWEIEKAMEVYAANDVTVISDEIWSDLTMPGYSHIPTQSVSEDARNRTVALYAPSKTFNLAGLIGSYHIIYNKTLNDRVCRQSSLCGYNEMNVLSMHALIGGYSAEGEEWLEELRQVLAGNIDCAVSYIRTHFAGVTVDRPQGTYLLLPDCGGWCRAHGMELDEMLHRGYEAGVYWQDGRPFFRPDSVRMNLALPLSRVQEALARLDRFVFNGD